MSIPIPHKCPRGRNDCIALANLVSDGAVSFFCCGENNGQVAPIAQDRYTVCFRGEYRDDTRYYDKRDLLHHAAVMLQAVAVVEKDVSEESDWSPWSPTEDSAP